MINIVEMNKQHWKDVANIYQQGISSNISTLESEVPTWEKWDETHREDGRFVATKDGEVVGFVILSSVSSRKVYAGVVEVSVYVHEEYRGEGVGKLLLNKTVDFADNNNIWTLQSGVLEENEASIQLHEKCGFKRVGIREKIGKDKFGLWRNIVFMERRSRKIGFEGCDMSCCKMKI